MKFAPPRISAAILASLVSTLPARAKVIARRLPGFFAKKPKDADALARLERWLSA